MYRLPPVSRAVSFQRLGRQSPFQKLMASLPPIVAKQFTPQNVPRTIKYVTWLTPALLYPPLTYFSTKDKKTEGKENLLQQYGRYGIGPLIQLGVDALLTRFFSKHTPQWFGHPSELQISSFLLAYLLYTAWETVGLQEGLEIERRHKKATSPLKKT